jgi:hypothetical protein
MSALLKDSKLGLGGKTQKPRPGSSVSSTLHNTSSINDKPDIKARPSDLDLNGGRPPRNPSTVNNSTLHNTSSINNKPTLRAGNPSDLDRNGTRPKTYTDDIDKNGSTYLR